MESYSYDEHRPVKETEGLDRLKGRKSIKTHESPYIYLSPIMNNFEVNLIFSKFLDMWGKNPTVPYVQLTTFVTKYKLYTFGIVQKFFAGACKIYSNVLINHVQIVDFMETIDKDNTVNLDEFFKSNEIMNIPEYYFFYIYIFISSKSSAYSIKAFTQFIRNSVGFQEKFVELQYVLLKDIFPAKYQQRIYKRYQFYTLCRKGCILSKSSSISSKITSNPHNQQNSHNTHNPQNASNVQSSSIVRATSNANLVVNDSIPKENCFEKITRILLNEPKPYHFDYCICTISNPDFASSDNYLDTLVLLIKQAYGYGYRTSRTSKFLVNRQISDNNLNHSNRNSHIHGTSTSLSPIMASGNRASRKHTIEKASALQHGIVKKLSNRESFSPTSSREVQANSARHQLAITSK